MSHQEQKKYKTAPNLQNKQFGKWTVINKASSRFGGRCYWLCKCQCGTLKEVSSQTLLNQTSKCCSKCSPRVSNVTHGCCRNKKIPEYYIWNSIKVRCRNPNDKGFSRYGARGINICDKWFNSFSDFISDVGIKPFKKATLDRIDNDKGYEPGNVRWTTMKIQNGNTRRQLLINGSRVCIAELSRKINRCRFWVSKKLKEGILPERLYLLEGPPYRPY